MNLTDGHAWPNWDWCYRMDRLMLENFYRLKWNVWEINFLTERLAQFSNFSNPVKSSRMPRPWGCGDFWNSLKVSSLMACVVVIHWGLPSGSEQCHLEDATCRSFCTAKPQTLACAAFRSALRGHFVQTRMPFHMPEWLSAQLCSKYRHVEDV